MISINRIKKIFPEKILFFSLLLSSSVNAEGPPILLRNAAMIITMDPELSHDELGIIMESDILISDGSIIKIGKNLASEATSVINVSGKIILPGFIDIHNHLFQSVMRSCGTDKDIYGWLEACIYPLSDKAVLNEKDAYSGVRLGSLDLINSGVTTVADWSSAFTSDFVDGNLRALKDSKMRFLLAYKVSSVDQTIIRHIESVIDVLENNTLGTLQLAPVPGEKEPLRSAVFAMAELSKKRGVQLHVHLHEGSMDRNHGQIDSLIDAGVFGPNLLAAHAIHLTDSEVKLIANHGVRLAHNPISNMRIGSGVMRLSELLDSGVKIGLGQDGGAISNGDMFNSMRTAINLQRVISRDKNRAPTVNQILKMATIIGAEILNISDITGSITPGKRADLIVINPDTINFAPKVNLTDQIVFNSQPDNVEWVFVDGVTLKRDGKLVNSDINSVIKDAQVAADKISRLLAN